MNRKSDEGGLGGILKGLAGLIESLSDLAEKGAELRHSGQTGGSDPKGLRGVYGINVKMGLGPEGEVKVEPFGSVRPKQDEGGQASVHEIREPMVDLFDEDDGLLLVAEMPGVERKDIQAELAGDVLTISAHGSRKEYRKEVLLPRSPEPATMTIECHDGVVEIRFPAPPKREK